MGARVTICANNAKLPKISGGTIAGTIAGPKVWRRVQASDSTTNHLSVADNCIVLPCTLSGTYGCFICPKDIPGLLYMMSMPQSIIVKKHDDTIVRTLPFIQYLLNNSVCLKVFKRGITAKQDYDKEYESMQHMRNVLNEMFITHTTFRTYDEEVGFTMSFTDNIKVNVDGVKIDVVHVLLLQTCASDLKGLTYINANELLHNIVPVLEKLHNAEYYAYDIKPQNIVYCPNDTIKYKLIDVGMCKDVSLMYRCRGTIFYKLRWLLQKESYADLVRNAPLDEETRAQWIELMHSIRVAWLGHYNDLKALMKEKEVDMHEVYKASDYYALILTMVQLKTGPIPTLVHVRALPKTIYGGKNMTLKRLIAISKIRPQPTPLRLRRRKVT